MSIRLLTLILLVSSVVTLILAAWQLWADYERDIDSIEGRLDILEQTTLEPLSNSIWALNEEQIRLLLTGMLNLESVVGVELRTDQGRHYFYGEIPHDDVGVVRRYPLVYRAQALDGPPYSLGNLTIHTSLDTVYARLFDRAANILVGQALKTFVVSIFILLIVQHLITRHLGRIADYARNMSPRSLENPLTLERRRRDEEDPDELDQVESALNFMRTTLLSDIGRREAAERELQASEARYRQLFQSSSDGLAILDPEGNILSANPALLNMLGYRPADNPLLTLTALTPETWHETDARMIAGQAMVSGQCDEYRKELLRRDGQRLPVSVRAWRVGDLNGKPQFLTLRVRDVSQEARLEEEQRRLQQHMNETQRLETVGTLAGGVAHEFNNLLTPIKGYAELLLKEPGNTSAAASRAEAIVHAAERGRRLVEKILLLSRKGSPQHTPTNISTLVRETLELANLTRPPNVRTSLHVRSAHTTLVVDPLQIHQAIMNLLLNAFHAMPSGGALDVSVEASDEGGMPGLAVSVSDTGIGIAAEFQQRIFEPFFSTRPHAQSSGLGLAVVHGIVTSHEGKISVQSQPGNTTFRIWLPHLPQTAAQPQAEN